jgi:CheY-like chemotaxis protein
MTSSNEKKIMLVCDNKKRAEQLKRELEQRKICDVVDIYNKPKQAIEELGLQKDSLDYTAFIVDDDIEYPVTVVPPPIAPLKPIFSPYVKNREDPIEIRRAKEAAKRKTDSLQAIQKNLEAMGFYQFCKQLQQIKPDARIILLTDEENMSSKMKAFGKKKEDFERYSGFYGMAELNKREYAFYTAIEEFRFDVGYIKKPIKSYGHVASKINQLLVTGTYQVEKIYGHREEERKVKSKRAFDRIMAGHRFRNARGQWYVSPIAKVTAEDFNFNLQYYGKDITEKEHAAQIVKRLRGYENEKMQEVEKVRKLIRSWEDRFPSIVEDPSAFEVVKEEKRDQGEGGAH